MNLEERQYCRQIYHFLNIDKENKLGGKHAVLFKSLLSLLGEPTWSQSLAEIHRIFTSLKTNIFLGKNALLSSRFVCEILTHQEMAPSWVSTHKNIHAKDKPAQPIFALKGETVPDSLPATPKSPPTRRVPSRGTPRAAVHTTAAGNPAMPKVAKAQHRQQRISKKPQPHCHTEHSESLVRQCLQQWVTRSNAEGVDAWVARSKDCQCIYLYL